MTRNETMAEWLERIEANAERLNASPHYVYRAFDSYGLLLYVGCTVNVKARMSAHRSGSKWHRFAETLSLTEYSDRATARAAEKVAIDSEGAYFNATQADIQRTQANRNAAKQSLWRRGWYRPTVSSDVDPRVDEQAWTDAWDAIADESDAWDRAVGAASLRLKAGAFPYMTDADRLARYLAAREDAELASQERAA